MRTHKHQKYYMCICVNCSEQVFDVMKKNDGESAVEGVAKALEL